MRERKLSKKDINYALFGLFLGDATLRFHNQQSKVCRLFCAHTNKQKEYVEFLENFFKKNNCDVLSKYDYLQNSSFGEFMYSYASIKIPSPRHFIKFNRCIIEEKSDKFRRKKIVTNYVLKRINPLGLLLWFLDDGSLKAINAVNTKGCRYIHRNAVLCTDSFSYFEHTLIKEMFKERFDIEVTIQKNNNKYHRIFFGRKEFEKFLLIIKEYLPLVPKSMLYKFDLKYEEDNPFSLKNLIESAGQAI